MPVRTTSWSSAINMRTIGQRDSFSGVVQYLCNASIKSIETVRNTVGTKNEPPSHSQTRSQHIWGTPPSTRLAAIDGTARQPLHTNTGVCPQPISLVSERFTRQVL